MIHAGCMPDSPFARPSLVGRGSQRRSAGHRQRNKFPVRGRARPQGCGSFHPQRPRPGGRMTSESPSRAVRSPGESRPRPCRSRSSRRRSTPCPPGSRHHSNASQAIPIPQSHQQCEHDADRQGDRLGRVRHLQMPVGRWTVRGAVYVSAPMRIRRVRSRHERSSRREPRARRGTRGGSAGGTRPSQFRDPERLSARRAQGSPVLCEFRG